MSLANFFIISGTSGSGKTIALQVLEDLGFYCIDNLPTSLIPEMASRVVRADNSYTKCAVSVDSRNRDFAGELKADFDSLRAQDIEYRIIFLDADDDTLLKRYSETRRKHPLSDRTTSLAEAIAKERSLLEQIADMADYHFNTSHTTPHELRSKIRSYAATRDDRSLTLQFQSFGFKYGAPRDADFVFDVRCLPNPYWNPQLQPLTGLDPPVQQFLAEQPICMDMLQQIRDFVAFWLPRFIDDNRNYITVAIGCTGGKHRSVFLSHLLNQHFSENEEAQNLAIQTLVRHRELSL